MKKTERRPLVKRIREIIFTDKQTLEIFKYPLNENGSHIKKMSRAKRTNYNGRKKKNDNIESTDNTDNYENFQIEENSNPILEIEEKKIYPFEINFHETLQLPQISIDDTEPIQLSLDLIPNFSDTNFANITDFDFMINKFGDININNQDNFNLLRLF